MTPRRQDHDHNEPVVAIVCVEYLPAHKSGERRHNAGASGGKRQRRIRRSKRSLMFVISFPDFSCGDHGSMPSAQGDDTAHCGSDPRAFAASVTLPYLLMAFRIKKASTSSSPMFSRLWAPSCDRRKPRSPAATAGPAAISTARSMECSARARCPAMGAAAARPSRRCRSR